MTTNLRREDDNKISDSVLIVMIINRDLNEEGNCQQLDPVMVHGSHSTARGHTPSCPATTVAPPFVQYSLVYSLSLLNILFLYRLLQIYYVHFKICIQLLGNSP